MLDVEQEHKVFFLKKKIGIKGKLYAFDKSQNSINNLKKKLKKNIKIFQ